MMFFNSGLTYLKVHRQVLPSVHCTVIELLVPSHLPAYVPHLGWSGTPLSHSPNCFLKYSIGLFLIFLICPGMQLNSLSIFLIGLFNIFVCIAVSCFVPSSLYFFISPRSILLYLPILLSFVCSPSTSVFFPLLYHYQLLYADILLHSVYFPFVSKPLPIIFKPLYNLYQHLTNQSQ